MFGPRPRGMWYLVLVAATNVGIGPSNAKAEATGVAAPHETPYEWHLPRGFPAPAVPSNNPMSTVKVDLGRRLFFEPKLSVTGRYSCASCHDPTKAYTDGRSVALGANGDSLPHSSMSLINVA